ncbi:MAG TPA: Crp/Fnr family transcriptional regulator, partial [Armatimonadota bacterium]|nr:Crp/Fnr family transcriptional regulator [Armatimonadota bacterium]
MVTRTKSPCELVREFPFFAGLDPAIYDVLLARGLTRRYAKGEMLFLDGEPCKGLFFVQSGMVKIFKLNENGREQILAVQRPGDSVAELPVFDDGPYPASAAAMEDAEVLFIPAAAFHELLTQYPQLCHAVITALGRRLRTLVGLVEDLSLRQVRQRLARLLLEESAGGGITLQLSGRLA